ncbi:TPR-like protein [Hyphopichia burtonii NRRL Y-1933]|uniref:TPR-like protein n=1 Tax=Hyphopichia burtonii NRRL Y-1933 TaxID=984485 RepID=A0A1E4RQ04_9ASCO|nr:TPR-like protein [Hyphopichia burtonii NRRL Y-1933]ODV69308.1 TPR-like protein [Hyphopichia burtonii NRRL Y-1933]
MSTDSINDLRKRFYTSSIILSNLNLFQSAKWCAEALNGLPQASPDAPAIDFSLPELDEDEKHDQEKFLLAKTYFNCKEFDRAAYVLKDCKSGNALFLKLYSTLISVDKKATEETDGSINVGSLQNSIRTEAADNISEYGDSRQRELIGSLNSKLSKVIRESENYHSKGNKPNAFLYYLSGIIYNKKKKYSLAQNSLFQSLRLFPYNWSCWQELIASLTTFDEAMSFINKAKSVNTSLVTNIMFQFFEVVILQEFYQQLASLSDSLNTLLETFPKFNFLRVQQFLIAYHGLDYFQAEAIFDQILMNDPLRLDDLDTYSNMLYVMEKRSKLSFLAQLASLIDKFRPETCCIVANYHSMKCEHEKAIMYYKRALTLNKNCLSAWTLMGHEFVELKNSHAAIESYRRAVDTNQKDFRAWYGLGQAYEVLDMHLYALYYYQRATNLQPLDKRMWQALGNCYEKIDKLEEAMKAFEKAMTIDNFSKTGNDNPEEFSVEPHVCYKLALISEKLGRLKDTYKYMRICFDQEYEWGISDETSKARLWLARHALENRRFEEAYELAKEMNLSNAHDVEEARSIARDARSRLSK